MTIFETHAHYDDEQFDEDRDELLSSFTNLSISPVINVGASLAGAKASLELAEQYPFIYAAIGVHPSEIDDLDDAAYDWIEAHAGDERVVSIGEIGLDYYWEKDDLTRKRQQEHFRRQLAIAREADLPVIIHSREAAEDTYDILRDAIEEGTRGVMHCYSYSPEMAHEYVKRGFFLGIGGVVTFKNGKKLKKTVEEIPIEHLLIETDSPYLAPEPFRGNRNDSTYLPYIIKEIARIKEITEAEVIEATSRNARRLFDRVK